MTSPSDVSIAVSSKNAGDTIQITYIRGGSEQTASVTLGSDDQSTQEYAENGAPAQNSNGGNSGGYGFNPFGR